MQWLKCWRRGFLGNVMESPRFARPSLEPLETRDLPSVSLSGSAPAAPFSDPIARIVAEVQEFDSPQSPNSFYDYFTHLFVNEGDRKGYHDRQPDPQLVAERHILADSLRTSLVPHGGSVVFQGFLRDGLPGQNIIGILPGHGPHANEEYLLGAHYDSGDNAPGADDAATGVSGVLEAANVLATHSFDRTLLFVLFDQEEVRLNGWGRGGTYFGQQAAANHENIRGAFILDQLAFNPKQRDMASIGPPDKVPNSPSALFAAQVAQAYQQYTTLNVVFFEHQTGTDAQRLFQQGFAAAAVEEAENGRGAVLNPFYDTPHDYYRNAQGGIRHYRGEIYLDLAYATEMTRGGVAWAAIAAGLQGSNVIPSQGVALGQAALFAGTGKQPMTDQASAKLDTVRPPAASNHGAGAFPDILIGFSSEKASERKASQARPNAMGHVPRPVIRWNDAEDVFPFGEWRPD